MMKNGTFTAAGARALASTMALLLVCAARAHAQSGAVLLESGPLVNCAGCGEGGADASVLQIDSLGMLTQGFGQQADEGFRTADDFTVIDPEGWRIGTITFYAYQTGSPAASSISAVYLQIWDGPPDDPASSVVWGNTTTNRLRSTIWSNVYRVTENDLLGTDRPVMAVAASVNHRLPPGTYWLDWSTDGSLNSGPWAPPVTVDGQDTTGNALRYVPAPSGSWVDARDSGTLTQQGFPFVIRQGRAVPVAPVIAPLLLSPLTGG